MLFKILIVVIIIIIIIYLYKKRGKEKKIDDTNLQQPVMIINMEKIFL